MELRHLRYFVAVAEELHFGRAAARSFVAQPTLSQQIKTFEGEVGARLFERSPRVSLTPVGAVLLPHARRVLDEAARAEAAVRAAAEGRAGALRVGYEAPIMRDGLAESIRAFRADVPDAGLHFWEAGSREQVEAVREGRADAGLVLLPVDERGVEVRALAESPIFVVLPEGHRLAGRETVALAELSDEPQVAWARDPAPEVYDQYLRACGAAGFVPRVVQEVRHVESLLGLVAAGVGVGTMHAARVQPGYPGVAFARLVEPALTIQTGAVWRRGDGSPLLARFLDAVVSPAPPL
ncbi:LysR family transcriptional regulator [Rubrivirga sp. S365]|uniref:LysR family transcriptional regulator n=1 Tax=Rubrivirga sp. S365 TaxID=3076080 RepID=UPI0028CAA757|nr:LysR family transcriptional regulator [Rubrivirga sp. S365]MDT7857384.1 LysR family transcriptional regulator [Rubrivirga sp. S365]